MREYLIAILVVKVFLKYYRVSCFKMATLVRLSDSFSLVLPDYLPDQLEFL